MTGFYEIARRIIDLGLSHYLEEYEVFTDEQDRQIYSFAKMRRNVTLLRKEYGDSIEITRMLDDADTAVKTAYEMAKGLPSHPKNKDLMDYQFIKHKVFIYYVLMENALKMINKDRQPGENNE